MIIKTTRIHPTPLRMAFLKVTNDGKEVGKGALLSTAGGGIN